MSVKVLIVSSYPGFEKSVDPEAEMVLRLKESGVAVDVMTEEGTRYARLFRESGMKIFDIQNVPIRKYSKQVIQYIRATLKEGKYDVVHVFNNRLVRNAAAAVRGLDVQLITYRGFAGHVHWYKPTSYLGHLNPRVKKITCVSDGVRNQVRRQLFFNKQKAVTVYKGHDPQWYREIKPFSKEEIGFCKDQYVVGCVANARPMKGIPYLLDAMKYLKDEPDIHLALIGKNMDTSRHMKLIRQLPNAENVHLLGYQDEVTRFYPAFDVSILTSVRGEGLSKVLIEAMSMGTPVIGTQIPGNDELILPNQTGILIPPRSSRDIAQSIREMKNNPGNAMRLGENAKNHIEENFRIDDTVKQMKEIYESVALPVTA